MRRLLPAAAILSLTACAVGMSGPPVPLGMAPATESQVRSWVMATRPAYNDTVRIHWKLQDENGGGGGSGVALIASADSLRFDFAGPLRMGRFAAFVIGDSAIWAQPEDQVKKVVPSYPLLWAMLGIARPPAPGRELRGIDTPKLTAWQYIRGGDTVTYVHTKAKLSELSAEVREGGKQVGYVVTKFDSLGHPLQSRLRVQSPAALVDLDVTKLKIVRSFPKGSWDAPRDSL